MNLFLVLLSMFIYASCQSGTGINGPVPKSVAEVSILTNKKMYEVNENLLITVTNALEHPITSPDQQTNCSIVIIERQEDGTWLPIRNCTLNSPGLQVTIKANTTSTVDLAPNSHSAGKLASGTYRARLVYSIGELYMPGQAHSVSSEPFSIR